MRSKMLAVLLACVAIAPLCTGLATNYAIPPGRSINAPPYQATSVRLGVEEASELCADTGIEWACAQMFRQAAPPPGAMQSLILHGAPMSARQHGKFLDRAHRAASSDRATSSALVQPSAAACPAEGQVVFAHVMKTAGLAVDAHLACRAAAEGWSVFHSDGESHGKRPKDSPCEPSVCTLHGPVVNSAMPDLCGPAFKNARVFTVLRDPVSRVWSFYNYLRQKKYRPYLENSLKDVILNIGAVNLNEELNPSDRCPYCPRQLSNSLVLYNFAGRETFMNVKLCQEASGNTGCKPTKAMLDTALKEALVVMASLSSIYFIEDMEQFPALFDKDPDFAVSPDPVASCGRLKQTNPSKYTEVLDDETRALITHVNQADVQLYEYAKTLPNLASEKGPAVKVVSPAVRRSAPSGYFKPSHIGGESDSFMSGSSERVDAPTVKETWPRATESSRHHVFPWSPGPTGEDGIGARAVPQPASGHVAANAQRTHRPASLSHTASQPRKRSAAQTVQQKRSAQHLQGHRRQP